MADIFSISRILIGVGIMLAAAVSDWRTRKVSNAAWLVMGGLGLLLLTVQMHDEGYSTSSYLILIVVGILFFDVFWDREPMVSKGRIHLGAITLHLIALACVILMIREEGVTTNILHLLSIPAMILVAELFFYTGLLHGGADAKALMALVILFPFHPQVEGLPLIGFPENLSENVQLIFPFAFLILMNAAILQVITVPTGLCIRNLAKRDTGFPEMFLGYRMRIDDVPKRFVWPMEVVRDGEVVLMLFPKRRGNVEKELAKLREMGLDEIWVTPKVPFIIPMLLGLVFSLMVGNIIHLIL
jgi:preflagellin peptidase FlaK